MYLMNFNEFSEDNFSSVYEFYRINRIRNEIFGYDNFKYYNYDGLMELAMVLRDTRV